MNWLLIQKYSIGYQKKNMVNWLSGQKRWLTYYQGKMDQLFIKEKVVNWLLGIMWSTDYLGKSDQLAIRENVVKWLSGKMWSTEHLWIRANGANRLSGEGGQWLLREKWFNRLSGQNGHTDCQGKGYTLTIKVKGSNWLSKIEQTDYQGTGDCPRVCVCVCVCVCIYIWLL